MNTVVQPVQKKQRRVNFLNLPSWTILSSRELEDDYEITARPIASLTACPYCESKAILRHGTDAQIIRDVPSHGKRVTIHVDRQRFRCTTCTRTFFEVLPDVDEQRFCTKRLIIYLQRRSMSRTFLSLAEEVGMHERSVRRIFHTYSQELAQATHFATPRVMGMDELHVIHQARGIITNIEAGTVVEFLADRKKQTVIRYLSHLRDPGAVEVVCIDMWQPYRDAVRQCLPNAVIVIDKFHAVKMANEALEGVRKQVRSSLDEKQRRTLMHDRFLLLRRRSDLQEKDVLILETWTKNFPVLGQAYELKESFYGIWDAATKDEAYKRYITWQEGITSDVSDAFTPIALTIEEWGDEIFAYFDHRVTNAYTESLNGLARVANRLGRGYSFDVLRTRLLYGIGQHPNRKPKKEEAPSVDSDSLGVPISTLADQDGNLSQKGDDTTNAE
jgi:transposase